MVQREDVVAIRCPKTVGFTRMDQITEVKNQKRLCLPHSVTLAMFSAAFFQGLLLSDILRTQLHLNSLLAVCLGLVGGILISDVELRVIHGAYSLSRRVIRIPESERRNIKR